MAEKKKQERKPAEDVRPAKDGYVSKMNGAKGVCRARRTNGEPCHGLPMANGVCRAHGGKSTGPRDPEKLKRNTNAVKTGEYQTIWLDALDDDEMTMYDNMTIDPVQELTNEIKLLTVRERRMLKRIEALQGTDFMPSSIELGSGIQNGRDMDYEKETVVSSAEFIQRIEEGLTRIQKEKARLIAQKHEIESMTKKPDSDATHLINAIKDTTNIGSLFDGGNWEDTGEHDGEDDDE